MAETILPRSDDPDKPCNETTGKKIGRVTIITITLLILIALCISVIYLIVLLWPSPVCKGSCFHTSCYLSYDQRLFILVALGGALGAFIHASTSFVDFTGNKKLVYSWLPWYIMRPFIGSALAVIFYLVIRGGLITAQLPTSGYNSSDSISTAESLADTSSTKSPADTFGSATLNIDTPKKKESYTENTDSPKQKPTEEPVPLNPYGLMAIACMAGLFSKQATDKLREVFENLFQVKDATPRHDKLNNNGKPIAAAALPPSNDDAGGDIGEQPQS